MNLNKIALMLFALVFCVRCGNYVYINNWDDIIIIGGNITTNVLTPTSSEMLRALASVNDNVKIAMGQTYGGENAKNAWNWKLGQNPPFQTPLNYESGIFFINGSTAADLNIAMWQFGLVMVNYILPGCASGWVPEWTENLVVACTQLLDVDIWGSNATTYIYMFIVLAIFGLLIGLLYFLMGMFYKSTARKIKDT